MAGYFFLGSRCVGKSHLILYTAKVISRLDKKVLVVDATSSEGVSGFFNINSDIEMKSNYLEREGFDIVFIGNASDEKLIEFINKENEKYDYVLIEYDKEISQLITDDSDKIILIQNFDKTNLLNNKIIIKDGLENKSICLVLNMAMDCKLKKKYILNYLKIDSEKIIEIPFIDTDYKASIDNKMDGRLNFKKFSEEHNKSILEIAACIENLPTDKKLLKRVLI